MVKRKPSLGERIYWFQNPPFQCDRCGRIFTRKNMHKAKMDGETYDVCYGCYLSLFMRNQLDITHPEGIPTFSNGG